MAGLLLQGLPQTLHRLHARDWRPLWQVCCNHRTPKRWAGLRPAAVPSALAALAGPPPPHRGHERQCRARRQPRLPAERGAAGL